MDIVLLNDGKIMPFNIKLSRDSSYSLLGKATENTEEIDGVNGEINFETSLLNSEFKLKGVFEFKNKHSDIDILKSQFIECLSPQKLYYESDLDKYVMAHITGKPEFTLYPTFCEINFTLALSPVWLSAAEKTLVGNGTLTNSGTFETGLIIEIAGPITNPAFFIGAKSLSYAGSLVAGDLLVIDTLNQTVKKNNQNASSGWCNDFPLLSPGSIVVSDVASSILFKWHDCWI